MTKQGTYTSAHISRKITCINILPKFLVSINTLYQLVISVMSADIDNLGHLCPFCESRCYPGEIEWYSVGHVFNATYCYEDICIMVWHHDELHVYV